MPLTQRFRDAFLMAFELHGEQVRKGVGDTPYITHLMAVSALVGEYGGSEDQMIAALLHDAIEDQGGPVAREKIRGCFGDRIVGLVDGCSDTDECPKPPWRERKERYLAHLPEASHELRLIVAADKLHNVRSLMADLALEGNALWQRFKGGREGSLWFYSESARVLREGWDHPIAIALDESVTGLHSLANEGNEGAAR